MTCLCSDHGEKNQWSHIPQVLTAVSALALSLQLHLYSQRFVQVLLGNQGHDIVTKVTLRLHVASMLE